jgi:hypothetical protein
MSIHDGFLEMAAAAIDFDLDEYDRAELDRHLAGCGACRATAAAYHQDAAAISAGARPLLSPARSAAILADALRPPRRSPSPRLAAVAALAAILVVGLGAVGMRYLQKPTDPLVAVVPSPGTSSVPLPDTGATPGPTGPADPTQRPPGTPGPIISPEPDALPVRASAQELGSLIRMAPGPAGGLYVSIPASGGSVLSLFDSTGRARAGWPIVLAGTTSCELLLPVADGSVRLLCAVENPLGNRFAGVRAYAFDSTGSLLAGWPIELADQGADGYFAGRVIGDELMVIVWKSLGDQIESGQPAGNAWIVAFAPDGTARDGANVAYGTDCCSDTWAIGPDGVAYGTVHHVADTAAGTSSGLEALGPAGVPAGFPVGIEGIASKPAFDAAGRIHVTVGTPFRRPARTLVFGPDGRGVGAGSDSLPIAATSDFSGAGGYYPAPPLVGADGTTFIIDTVGGTTVAGLGPSGQVLAGWPYHSDRELENTGFCGPGDTGCGQFRAAPTIGPDNVLYLLRAAANSSAGGSIIAVGQDGKVVKGWPVGLTRAGSEFWSVVVGPDGTVYVLAVEPEPNRSYSATILSIAANSHVLDKVTIVEP